MPIPTPRTSLLRIRSAACDVPALTPTAPQARAEIDELITQLEACNPTASPTESAELLSGTWNLAYTSNSELMGVLALGRLPGVEIGEVSQTIDIDGMTVKVRSTLQFAK